MASRAQTLKLGVKPAGVGSPDHMRRSSLFLLSLVAAACGDQEGEEVPFVELAADSEDSIDGFNASNPPPSRVALDPSVSGFESGGALLAATDTFQGAVPGRHGWPWQDHRYKPLVCGLQQ
ncbi:MAG: hypothetical protein AAFX94_25775, partial [Myxococcota bacterium]